jgi:hypothetical protein
MYPIALLKNRTSTAETGHVIKVGLMYYRKSGDKPLDFRLASSPNQERYHYCCKQSGAIEDLLNIILCAEQLQACYSRR